MGSKWKVSIFIEFVCVLTLFLLIMKTTKPPLPIWGHSVGELNSEAEVHPHGNRDLIEFGRTHQGITIGEIPILIE